MTATRSTASGTNGFSPELIRTGYICLGLLGIAGAGLLLDDRRITGAPAWLKPAKFGASGAIYLVTMAWMMRTLPRTRLLRVAAFLTVWVMSAIVLWAHCRTTATDRAMAIALRLGLALNIVGAGVGWTMTQPRPAQLEAMRRNERPYVAGSHTIGAPDGGPGLPVTQWSRTHGDLRIPHFLGMHAWQLLPLLLLGLRRARARRDDALEIRMIGVASAASAAIFLASFLQAMAGLPLLSFAATGP